MNIILTILILGVIILVHEMGHFFAARYFKIPVEEFAIGMGPVLYSYKGKETKYSIRAIPMGGFVNIKGMEVESVVEDGFNSKSKFARFTVLIAGVLVNFIFAYILVFGNTIYNGKVEVSDKPIISEVLQNTNASNSLKANDEIMEIDGYKIKSWGDIQKVNSEIDSKIMEFKILRDNKIIVEDVKLTYDEKRKDYFIGILPKYDITKYGFIEGIKVSTEIYNKLFSTIVSGFSQLVTGKVDPSEISGPVGMVKIVGSVSSGGPGLLLWLTALLSINIGFFNLLPFPALDGGRIIFVLLEAIGIRINKKFEEKFHMVGMVILLGLIILITSNDILKIFK